MKLLILTWHSFCVKTFQKFEVNTFGLGWKAGESRKNPLSELQALVSISQGPTREIEAYIETEVRGGERERVG